MDGNASGNFVVVWSDKGAANSTSIRAQRLNAAGVKQGGEVLVETINQSRDITTDVAIDAAGNFVVTWNVRQDEGFVFARRFNAAGVAQAPTFIVNTTIVADPSLEMIYPPSIDMDDAGNFVVAWEQPANSSFEPFRDFQVRAQRFNAAGTKQGGEFEVTTLAEAGASREPDVAMNSQGQFAITWYQLSPDRSTDILVQRYAATGVQVGTRIQADQSSGDLYSPSIALNDAGNFVVAWSDLTDGDDDVMAREFGADGKPSIGQLLVNDSFTGSQYVPEVALNDKGQYVVTWIVYDQSTRLGTLFGKRFTLGTFGTQSAEFQISSNAIYTSITNVALADNGTFLASWDNENRTANDSDIHGRFHDFGPPPNTPPVANNDAVTVLEDSNSIAIDVLGNDTDANNNTLTLLSATGGTQGGIVQGQTGGSAVGYRPPANFFGTDTFAYTVQDGQGGTDTAIVIVTVLPVNDAPSFTVGANQTVNNTAGAQTVSNFATNVSRGPANESNQTFAFNVTSNNNELFAVQPSIGSNGALTYTPAPGKTGTATVSAVLKDNGGTERGGQDSSTTQTFTITLTGNSGSTAGSVSGSGKMPAPNQTTKGTSFRFNLKPGKTGAITGQVTASALLGNSRFQSTSITKLTISGTQARIEGTGTINGTGNFTFTLDVNDLGKSKTPLDTLNLQISNSTSVSGTIASGDIKVQDTPR